MSYCKNCGTAIEDGINFCPECGTRITCDVPAPAPAATTDPRKEEKVKFWLMSNASKLPESQLHIIREKLLSLPESDFDKINYLQLTDPTLMIIISIFFGAFGIDRFAIGDIGLGLGKLLTCGGLYIWYLADLFYIMDAVKAKNYDRLNNALYI